MTVLVDSRRIDAVAVVRTRIRLRAALNCALPAAEVDGELGSKRSQASCMRACSNALVSRVAVEPPSRDDATSIGANPSSRA